LARNNYINKAIDLYNQLMKRKVLQEKYVKESKLVSKESLKVLKEFEDLIDDIPGL